MVVYLSDILKMLSVSRILNAINYLFDILINLNLLFV